ncbi:unnamed protein product [Amoebophrya sp. A120]|nr:unnamed protein product [Amoebophrya sp. A120]|eukprot:GSA120T00015364001.1
MMNWVLYSEYSRTATSAMPSTGNGALDTSAAGDQRGRPEGFGSVIQHSAATSAKGCSQHRTFQQSNFANSASSSPFPGVGAVFGSNTPLADHFLAATSLGSSTSSAGSAVENHLFAPVRGVGGGCGSVQGGGTNRGSHRSSAGPLGQGGSLSDPNAVNVFSDFGQPSTASSSATGPLCNGPAYGCHRARGDPGTFSHRRDHQRPYERTICRLDPRTLAAPTGGPALPYIRRDVPLLAAPGGLPQSRCPSAPNGLPRGLMYGTVTRQTLPVGRDVTHFVSRRARPVLPPPPDILPPPPKVSRETQSVDLKDRPSAGTASGVTAIPAAETSQTTFQQPPCQPIGHKDVAMSGTAWLLAMGAGASAAAETGRVGGASCSSASTSTTAVRVEEVAPFGKEKPANQQGADDEVAGAVLSAVSCCRGSREPEGVANKSAMSPELMSPPPLMEVFSNLEKMRAGISPLPPSTTDDHSPEEGPYLISFTVLLRKHTRRWHCFAMHAVRSTLLLRLVSVPIQR